MFLYSVSSEGLSEIPRWRQKTSPSRPSLARPSHGDRCATLAPTLHGRPSQLPVLLVTSPVWTQGSPAVPTVRPCLPACLRCVPTSTFGPRSVPSPIPSRSPRCLVCAVPAGMSPPRTRLLHQVLLSNITLIRCLLSGFSKTITSIYNFT